MTTITPADPLIKDFSARKDVVFRIDDDVFRGVPDLPAEGLVEFATMTEAIAEANISEQPKVFHALAELLLEEESAARFKARMSSRTEPISLNQIMEVTTWLMEQYGMRPTGPSSPSSPGDGSPGDGTSSTANTSVAELTFTNFPRTASST